ncbi:MAG: DnaJ domain-containing protein [Beijerinckiaceae bacterium]
MRDPYSILGVSRSAPFEDVRRAYRRACKTAHPDLGGTAQAFNELNTAYTFALEELRRNGGKPPANDNYADRWAYWAERSGLGEDAHGSPNQEWQEEPRAHDGETYANAEDIEEELANLRRTQQEFQERMRAQRDEAWKSGDRDLWAKLTLDDLFRFFGDVARSGAKGIATILAALTGLGAILLQLNIVSALLILGSALGFFVSFAVKSDKGGLMSAGLLLFGLAVVWMPGLRTIVFTWPFATVSILLCVAIFYKFLREGGTAAKITGGFLAYFVAFVVFAVNYEEYLAKHPAERQSIPRTAPQPNYSAPQTLPRSTTPLPPQTQAPSRQPPTPQRQAGRDALPNPVPAPPQITRPAPAPPPPTPAPPSPPPIPEIRELRAAEGSMLKFVAGINYRLKIRSGMTTTLVAASGSLAFYNGANRLGDCKSQLELAAPAGSLPYSDNSQLMQSCQGDAIFEVRAVR